VTKEGSGKIGGKILEFGRSHESATTQTLKLILTPVWKRANGTLGARDLEVTSPLRFVAVAFASASIASQADERGGPRWRQRQHGWSSSQIARLSEVSHAAPERVTPIGVMTPALLVNDRAERAPAGPVSTSLPASLYS
jgi:hypothetical protein